MIVSVARIQQITARKFKVPAHTITAKNNRGEGHNGRNRFEFSRPRQVAMYIAWQLTTKSKSTLGRLFGGRDHTTIIHAIHAVEQRLMNDRVLRIRINAIKIAVMSGENAPFTACRLAQPESLPCPMKKHTWLTKQNADRESLGPVYREIMRDGVFGPKVRDEDRVYRDPCIRCGVRGDIGCVHTLIAA